MNQFDYKRVSDYFRRSIPSYEESAKVQKDVGQHLIDMIMKDRDTCYGRVLEVGCCTGTMTELFCSACDIKSLFINDLVPECCESAAARVRGMVKEVNVLAGNIETVALPDRLDLVVSSSTFQWIIDLPGCLDRIANALRHDGSLAFSMFGPGTMEQVRELTGIGLTYTSESRLLEIMERQFVVDRLESTRHRIYFPTPREVLRHIQQTGVGGVGKFCWTRSKLKQFEEQYRVRFGEKLGVPLDYISIYAVGRKK